MAENSSDPRPSASPADLPPDLAPHPDDAAGAGTRETEQLTVVELDTATEIVVDAPAELVPQLPVELVTDVDQVPELITPQVPDPRAVAAADEGTGGSSPPDPAADVGGADPEPGSDTEPGTATDATATDATARAATPGTVPEPPASPDIPSPGPAGPPPSPEVPDVPDLPDGPHGPETGASSEVPPVPQVLNAAPAPPAPAAAPAAASSASGPGTSGDRSPKPSRPGRPGGRAGRPGGPRTSSAPMTTPTGVVEPTAPPVDPHLWGRIDEHGVVYVRTAAGERVIGNWQAGDNEAGLAHFGRRFDDFATEIAVLEARLASGTGDPKATKQQALVLRDSVDTLAAIGDLDGAAARLETVIGAADLAIAGASQARHIARANAIKAKEALCAEAEELAESTQWKATGDRLKSIVDEWRQIRGIDRKTDDALWKRFAKARDTFTRRRGSHFAELDKQRTAAKETKEALIARAEELSNATDWNDTAAAYRGLMAEWKAAGRAPRDVEDELWTRFRAAQEAFFSRRNQTFSERDAEFQANAAKKERLLAEAEKIDVSAGVERAKAALRSVQERWEAAGKVPRERIREFDSRLRAVEERVKSADERHWRRSDPEQSARVEQFRSRAEQYRAQAAKARAAGDERRAREADEQAEQWEVWLQAAREAGER
jgi:hypothetical protein